MLFYLLSTDELDAIYARLGYPGTAPIPRTIDYYLRRTSHGSTRRAAGALVGAGPIRPRQRLGLLPESLDADVRRRPGRHDREGIHLGAMAGTVDLLQRCFTGLEIRADALWIDPKLPKELRRLDFSILYRGHLLDLHFEEQRVTVASRTSRAAPVSVKIGGKAHELQAGLSLELRAETAPARRR